MSMSNKQSQTVNKGWFSNLEVGWVVANNPSLQKLAFYEVSQRVSGLDQFLCKT